MVPILNYHKIRPYAGLRTSTKYPNLKHIPVPSFLQNPILTYMVPILDYRKIRPYAGPRTSNKYPNLTHIPVPIFLQNRILTNMQCCGAGLSGSGPAPTFSGVWAGAAAISMDSF